MKIGYFVPEFPSQTHAFFRRELEALRALGVEGELVSTRRPRAGLASHSWAPQAIKETTYLFPAKPGAVLRALAELLRAGRRGRRQWVAALRSAGCPSGGRARMLGLALLGAQLAATARRGGWSHVHVHSCADSANIALFASMLSGVTYSLTLHGPLEHYGANQEQKWSNARFALVVTRTLLREVQGVLAGHLPGIVEAAPMGVDIAAFRRREPYRPWDGRGPLRVFSCGRLNPGKGHHDLIRSIAGVRADGLDARLLIAGEDDSPGGGYRKMLARLIEELSLAGCVDLPGAVSQERVVEELERAHVFCLASHNEAIGVATMEAMAMEVPAVVTGVGGVPELVTDGVDGLLVEPGAPDRMAEGILRIANDPKLARGLGAAGRRKVTESFHSGVSAQVIARCLGRVTAAG